MLANRVWPGMGQVAACFGQMNSSMPLLGQVKFGRGGVKSSVQGSLANIQGSLANIAFAYLDAESLSNPSFVNFGGALELKQVASKRILFSTPKTLGKKVVV